MGCQLSQRAGSPSLSGGGAAATVPIRAANYSQWCRWWLQSNPFHKALDLVQNYLNVCVFKITKMYASFHTHTEILCLASEYQSLHVFFMHFQKNDYHKKKREISEQDLWFSFENYW